MKYLKRGATHRSVTYWTASSRDVRSPTWRDMTYAEKIIKKKSGWNLRVGTKTKHVIGAGPRFFFWNRLFPPFRSRQYIHTSKKLATVNTRYFFKEFWGSMFFFLHIEQPKHSERPVSTHFVADSREYKFAGGGGRQNIYVCSVARGPRSTTPGCGRRGPCHPVVWRPMTGASKKFNRKNEGKEHGFWRNILE